MKLAIIKKDFKLVLKSKFALFTLFILPVIIVLILSISFSVTGLQNINIAYFNQNLTEDGLKTSSSIIEALKAKGYDIFSSNSSEQCIENVKSKGWHVCMIINQGKVKEELNIVFYVDSSRINIAYTLIHHISEIVKIRSEEISVTLIQAIIDVLDATRSEIVEKSNPKLFEFGKIISDIRIETAGIKTITNSIDTYFDIRDFNINELKDLIEGIGNASNLTPQLEDIAFDIERKLKQTKTKFETIESKKKEVFNSLSSIERLTETAGESIDAVRASNDKIIKSIDEVKVKEPSVISGPIKTSVSSIVSKRLL